MPPYRRCEKIKTVSLMYKHVIHETVTRYAIVGKDKFSRKKCHLKLIRTPFPTSQGNGR